MRLTRDPLESGDLDIFTFLEECFVIIIPVLCDHNTGQNLIRSSGKNMVKPQEHV